MSQEALLVRAGIPRIYPWGECQNACILSELLKRLELQGNQEQMDHIQRVSPVSWKHINFYGKYNFCEPSEGIDLTTMVDRVEALNLNRDRP